MDFRHPIISRSHYQTASAEDMAVIMQGVAAEQARRAKVLACRRAARTTSGPTSKHTTQPVPARKNKLFPRLVLRMPRTTIPVSPSQRTGRTLFFGGVGMLLALVGVLLCSWLFSASSDLVDRYHYGTAQIYQADLNVGHGGTSHFLTQYYHDEMVVIEWLPKSR